MAFIIGQQVIYPNYGVGTVERIENKQIGANALSMYELRLAYNNSRVLVPTDNIDEIGLRLPISVKDCEVLFSILSEDFVSISNDWKVRFKEYSEKIKRGELFEVADVLKKLTFLSRQKPLSFREQRLLEKARYLVVSELAAVYNQGERHVVLRIDDALNAACSKHELKMLPTKKAFSAVIH